MIGSGHYKAIEEAFPRNKAPLIADLNVLKVIEGALRSNRRQNPLKILIVQDLARDALRAWNDPSVGRDVTEYLEVLLENYPALTAKLEEAGHGLDVEVAVQADSTEEASKTTVNLDGQSLASNRVF